MDIVRNLEDGRVRVDLDYLPSEEGGSVIDWFFYERNGRTDDELIKMAWDDFYEQQKKLEDEMWSELQ